EPPVKHRLEVVCRVARTIIPPGIGAHFPASSHPHPLYPPFLPFPSHVLPRGWTLHDSARETSYAWDVRRPTNAAGTGVGVDRLCVPFPLMNHAQQTLSDGLASLRPFLASASCGVDNRQDCPTRATT